MPQTPPTWPTPEASGSGENVAACEGHMDHGVFTTGQCHNPAETAGQKQSRATWERLPCALAMNQ